MTGYARTEPTSARAKAAPKTDDGVAIDKQMADNGLRTHRELANAVCEVLAPEK